jgi:hypothetical protein
VSVQVAVAVIKIQDKAEAVALSHTEILYP